jgi:hypothetical protein
MDQQSTIGNFPITRTRINRAPTSSMIWLAFAASALASSPNFNRDIRPILSENCFLCHGQDPEHRGGDLRLDIREEAVAARDEGAAIVPGKPAESAIMKRILSKDPDMVMPPPEAHLTALKQEQIRTLEKWIEAGAEYEPHWAFARPVKAALPAGAPAHPVDAFIDARLAAESLPPSPQADPEALVRRLYLDLTGLPPEPAEVDAYLADGSPDRWEKLIDRLMESPHFAERLALPWLDASRYSDTHGFSIDDHRDMWGWRDWVIHAFKNNQPYDQFLTEQVAGDLIPGATPDQIAATGFLRNSMNTHEGGTIAEEYRVAYTLDKVDAVATSMLGLTMKCAQCHDHKYDPISQKEYFQFFAFFNSSSEPGKGATNANTQPVMPYQSPLAGGGIDGLKRRVSELEYLKLHPTEPVVKAREAWEETQKSAGVATAAQPSFPWQQFNPAATKWIWSENPVPDQDVEIRHKITIPAEVREAWLFMTCDDSAEVNINGQKVAKVELWSQPDLQQIGSHLRQGANDILISATNNAGTGGLVAVLAWRTDAGWQTEASGAAWEARRSPDADWKPATVIADFGAAPWNDVTLAVRDAKADASGIANILAIPAAERTAEHWNAVNAAFMKSNDPLVTRMKNVLKGLDVEIKVLQSDIKRGKTTVMVMDHKPELRKTHILIRGAYDQHGEEVGPGVPHVLPPLAASENPNRLDLAKWITREENPLTARVAVNRLWQMIFGRGIVETAGDFGNQGSWPTHPELLDWLAVDFVENGWDLRHVLRVILTSDAYRRSSAATPLQLEKDPRNEWLARSPRSRLPAEIIRDQALAVSGLLDKSIGGPGVHPPQPDLWSEISHFGYNPPFTAQKFYPGRGESTRRRSIYTFWKRTSPPPAMVLFDAPTRETCAVVRGSTNTPLQALVLLNEPQFVEAGVALGRRMLDEGGASSASRISHGFRLVTGRAPTAAELDLLERSFTRHLERYSRDPDAAHQFAGSAEHAAHAMIASTLLNLDETITRP